VNLHRLAEERSLALHRAIAERLSEDPSVLKRARTRVQRWMEKEDVARYGAEEWDRVLSGSTADICEWLGDESEHARAMRQVAPFAGAIDPRTRWRIWKEVRAEARINRAFSRVFS